jgi:hypothetical protein
MFVRRSAKFTPSIAKEFWFQINIFEVLPCIFIGQWTNFDCIHFSMVSVGVAVLGAEVNILFSGFAPGSKTWLSFMLCMYTAPFPVCLVR